MSHPHSRKLMAYYDGELRAMPDGRMARHVSRCDRCCDLLADFGKVGLALRGLDVISRRPPEAPTRVISRSIQAVQAFALSGVLLLVILAVALWPHSPRSGVAVLNPSSEVRPPAAPAPLATQAPVGAPTTLPAKAGDPPPVTQAPADEAPEAEPPPAEQPPLPGTPPTSSPAAPSRPVVGVALLEGGSGAALGQTALAAFTASSGMEAISSSKPNPLDAVRSVADQGARVVFLPLWPEGLDPSALEQLATERGLVVLAGGVASTRHVLSLRPSTQVEAGVAAAYLADGPSAVVVFAGDDPDDQAFADSLRRELDRRGVAAPVEPAGRCPAKVTEGVKVAIAANRAAVEGCALAAQRHHVQVLSRAGPLAALTSTVPTPAFVSPLALPSRAGMVEAEIEALSHWAGVLVAEAATKDPDLAVGLGRLEMAATASAPQVDLSRPRPVLTGTVVSAPAPPPPRPAGPTQPGATNTSSQPAPTTQG